MIPIYHIITETNLSQKKKKKKKKKAASEPMRFSTISQNDKLLNLQKK